MKLQGKVCLQASFKLLLDIIMIIKHIKHAVPQDVLKVVLSKKNSNAIKNKKQSIKE